MCDGLFPGLSDKQQDQLEQAIRDLEIACDDVDQDNQDVTVDEVFFDLVEAVAWDIHDPLVRKEFHRINGAYDRQTGYDPMDGV